MGLDILKIYVTIDTKVVELGSCDADHISMIVLLHMLYEKQTGSEKVPEDDYNFSGFEQNLFGDNEGDHYYEDDHYYKGDNEYQVELGDEAGEVGLGDEFGNDDSLDVGEVPAIKALAVLHEVLEEACEVMDDGQIHGLLERYQSKSDDEYCSNSGDEVSGAKLTRVIKSNSFKQLGFNFNKVKNDKTRLTWACMAKGCPWRLHTSNVGDETTMQVKTYKNEHNCHWIYKSNEARAKWIAGKFQDLVISNPRIQACVISHLLRDQFNVIVDTQRLYKAKKRALDVLLKDHEACFKHLRAYAIMVLQCNPGSVAYIHLLENTTTFQRIFVSFKTQRKGFLEGCRPFLGLDGCHLNGPYGGILLLAIALNANNGLYPFTYCICEGETFLNWSWFCVRRIYANFRTAYGGQKLRTLFWRAFKTVDKYEFKKCLANIGTINIKAMAYLANIEPCHWSMHAFDASIKCESVTNNMTEAFNISGVPCSHALAVIRHHYGVNGDEGNLAKFIDPMLSKSAYLRTNSMIHPISDLCVWADLETSLVEATPVKRSCKSENIPIVTKRKKVSMITDDVSVSSSQGATTSS
ncbi:hypothetical protein EZV62_014843 [Acer yangbiense]|uniref:Transposase MuDR plant domain-containing protein n=1 Tax=Acer yangbiense TaxID=1000413 RepID=A0A5C7HTM5_9ROSI|nr:hypothetical protein EZV62_014843 [Acer yangbiense]